MVYRFVAMQIRRSCRIRDKNRIVEVSVEELETLKKIQRPSTPIKLPYARINDLIQ